MRKGFLKTVLSGTLLAFAVSSSVMVTDLFQTVDVHAATMTFYVTSADFGANGADTKADSAQIQKALDTAQSIEGTINVKVPAGTYYLDKCLTIYSNTNLILEKDAVIKRAPGFSSIMLMNGADYTNVSDEYNMSGDFSVTGGTWDGTVTDVTVNRNESLFYFGHAHNISLSDVLIQNGYGAHLVEFTGVSDSSIQNVTFKNYLGDEGSGAEALYFSIVDKNACDEYRPHDDTPCKNITVANCTISNYASGIGAYSEAAGSPMTNFTIQENDLDNLTGVGISMTGGEGAIISNNAIYGSPENGIWLEDMRKVEIYSNEVQNCSGYGIGTLDSGATIKGNVLTACEGSAIYVKNPITAEITGNRIKSNPNGDGITVVNGNYATKITDNNLSDVGDYGILIYYGSQCEITNNYITNFGKCAISIQKSLSKDTKSKELKIHSNKITNGETGIEVYYADQTTVSNNIIKDTTEAGIILGKDCENSIVKKNVSDAPIEVLDSTATLTENDEGANGMIKSAEDGELYYYKNGKLDTTYVGLAQYENNWYYIENGVVGKDFTNLYCYKGTWYYVNKGIVDFSYTGLVKYNGSWFYVKNGLIAWNHTGIVQNQFGRFYVKNGKIDWSFQGLVQQDNTWYYMNKGTVDKSYAGLIKYGSSWYYVENGTINWKYTALVKYNGSWFYVENGVINFKFTGLVKQSGSWFYVKSGVLDWSYTGLVKQSGKWFYVKGGVLDWSYTGLVKHGNAWYYVKGGVLDFSYTGMVLRGNWFYVEKGVVNFGYTGLAFHKGTFYYVKNGVLDLTYSGSVLYKGKLYEVYKGVLYS